MKTNDILNLFNKANEVFIEKNKDIIVRDLNERCICAALAHEINKLLESSEYSRYYCDVEYNRNGEYVKKIYNDANEININNDLIIHSRGRLPKDNLLALEMKKERGSCKVEPHHTKYDIESDRTRLKCLTKQESYGGTIVMNGYEYPVYVCKYDFGIMYIINENTRTITIEQYENEQFICKNEINF